MLKSEAAGVDGFHTGVARAWAPRALQTMARASRKARRVVGLDIEPSQLAAVEVRDTGAVAVERAATAPLAAGIFRDGEVVDVDALSQALKTFFREEKLGKNVRLGVANQRIVVRMLDLPPLTGNELEAAVRFQAQEMIPMPLEHAVLDFHSLGSVATPDGPRTRIVLVAARRDMIGRLTTAARRAGLRPVGIDLAAFALIRALRLPGTPEAEAALYINVGGLTNIAIAQDTTCLFTRVVAVGHEGMAAELAERRGLTLEHARQWLEHVGLLAPVENVDGDPSIVGDARGILYDGVRRIADEARNSLDFYRATDGAVGVGRAVACGPALSIAGFVDHLTEQIGLPVEPGAVHEARAGALDGVDGARLAVAAGLAIEDAA